MKQHFKWNGKYNGLSGRTYRSKDYDFIHLSIQKMTPGQKRKKLARDQTQTILVRLDGCITRDSHPLAIADLRQVPRPKIKKPFLDKMLKMTWNEIYLPMKKQLKLKKCDYGNKEKVVLLSNRLVSQKQDNRDLLSALYQ